MLSNPSSDVLSSKYSKYALIGLATFFGTASCLSNIQFAAIFPYTNETIGTDPKDVSFDWLPTLSYRAIVGVLFNSISTFIISGAYAAVCIYTAMLKFYEELQFFKKCENSFRFPIEIVLAILAGLTGGSISGTPYTGFIQWLARFLGFVTVSSLSFLGLSQLIINMTDKDHAFKMKIISYLKNITEPYHSQLNALLNTKELNNQNVYEFLDKVFNLAQENREQNPVFQFQPERSNKLSLVDYLISGLLTLNCSLMYIQSGFSGLNILTNNYLNNLPNFAKILLGILAGSPLSFFVLIGSGLFTGGFAQHLGNICNNFYGISKLTGLLGLTAGNSAWYYGLATSITKAPNIFSTILSTVFGSTIFPAVAYITLFLLGINGLSFLLFPPKINIQQPQLGDVIKGLENNVISKESWIGLKQNSFFSRMTVNNIADVKIPEVKLTVRK